MNSKSHAIPITLFATLLAACAPDVDVEIHENADLILSGARIFTSNDQQAWAEAVAIRDGRFVYVGDSEVPPAYPTDVPSTPLRLPYRESGPQNHPSANVARCTSPEPECFIYFSTD